VEVGRRNKNLKEGEQHARDEMHDQTTHEPPIGFPLSIRTNLEQPLIAVEFGV
jgi:hypothetical protein